MQAQPTPMVMAGRDKATGQRVWLVQSTSGTKAAGHLVFHILTWDESAAAWVCPCLSRKPCIHMRLASDASKAEQQRADAAFDALTSPQKEQFYYTDDTGLRACNACGCQDDECMCLTNDYDDSNPRREEMEVTMKAEPMPVQAAQDVEAAKGITKQQVKLARAIEASGVASFADAARQMRYMNQETSRSDRMIYWARIEGMKRKMAEVSEAQASHPTEVFVRDLKVGDCFKLDHLYWYCVQDVLVIDGAVSACLCKSIAGTHVFIETDWVITPMDSEAWHTEYARVREVKRPFHKETEPIMARNDTGPRWLMGGMTKTAPSLVLAERQREAM